MTPLVDIGANLASKTFRTDVDAVIERAFVAGVGTIVVTGTNVEASTTALALAKRYPGRLLSTAGLHPHHASSFEPAVLAALDALAGAPEVVAIGECGLDYNRNFSSHRDQERCFEAHIELAKQRSLPLFLHEREAHEAFVSVLDRHPDRPRAVIHCFTGEARELEKYLAMGLYVGITGWICDERRGAHLKKLVNTIPLERLLIETDAPHLLPRDLPKAPKNGRNEPAFLPHVLRTIAQYRDESPEDLAAVTSRNAARFFGMKQDA